LGSGLLESAYEECLHYELEKIGLMVIIQKPMPLIYEEKKLIQVTGLICTSKVK